MTMSFQVHEGHVARSEDLHRHILRSHLAYLNQEETPSKLEQRHNLETLISEFLCVVSHNAKFTFLEVASVLHYSVENNPLFSAYKAQSAFEALEKYATNLISHPWRKEYKTIKLYSGFYKHSVENQLTRAESVFHLLGYKSTDDGILFLDEPIDPDKVTRVALDCLIAYVECQMMVQICEKVKSFKCSWPEINGVREDYVCGIDEAVRLLHQLKRNAIEQDKHDRWLRNQENGVMEDKKQSVLNYPKTGVLVDVSNTWPSEEKFIKYGSSVNDEQPFRTTKSLLSQSKLTSWCDDPNLELNNYHSQNISSKSQKSDNYASHSFDDQFQTGIGFPNKSSNHITRNAGSNVMSDCWSNSWDLIQSPLQSGPYHRIEPFLDCDLDSHRTTGYTHTVPNVKETYSSQFGHVYPPHPLNMMPLGIPPFPYAVSHDFTIQPRQCQSRSCSENPLQMMPNRYQQSSKDTLSDTFESNLSSLSRPDAHRRNDGEILGLFNKMSIDNPTMKSKNFPVVNSPAYSSYQTVSESTQDIVLRPEAEKIHHSNSSKRGSYYDNVPSTLENDGVSGIGSSLSSKCDFQSNGILTSNSTLGKVRSQKISIGKPVTNGHSLKLQRKSSINTAFDPLENIDAGPTVILNSDSKDLKPDQIVLTKDCKGGKKWSCTTCTFYNSANKNICDMCGRSKMPGPEVTPLVSGGRECPQCTLVNKKCSENCTACGASLKDSPTYI